MLAGMMAGAPARYVLIDAARGDDVREQLRSAASDERVPLLDVESDLLAQVVELAHPPRAVGVFDALTSISLDAALGGGGPCVYLDRVADPGNVGTIVRSAAAFGAHAVIMGSGTADPFAAKAIRASMGGIFSVPIVTGVAPHELVAAAGADRIVALDARAHESIAQVAEQLAREAVLVVGAERDGVSAELRAVARHAAISQQPVMESLNAGVAASIALYEWSRHA